jgi:hypothetical protein
MLWHILLFLQIFAAAASWIREGTAIALPLLAFRNVKLIQGPMRFCLPCAIAAAVWNPPMIAATRGSGELRKLWLSHVLLFTLLQHTPMFVGAHYYLSLVDDGGGVGRVEDDFALFKPIASVSQQAAVVGFMASAAWFAFDFVWPKLRASDEVQFSPL